MRDRDRTLSIRLDDSELARLHHLAEEEDVAIGAMVRRWLADHWRARFGDAPPPATKTKFGDAIRPRLTGGEAMSDVRHQATWRLVADGRWEVEVGEDLPAHLPAHVRDRFETDEDDGATLRCEAGEVVSVMAEIVKVAVWWEPPPRWRYRFRAARDFDAALLHDVLEEAGVEVWMWMSIPTAEGDLKVDFISDLPLEKLRGVMGSCCGGERMRETLVALDADHAGEPEPPPPLAKGSA